MYSIKRFLFLFLIVGVISCDSDKSPDVSHIEADVTLKRFDQDFFAIDTQNLAESLKNLSSAYPAFLGDYITNVLGLPVDSVSNIEGDLAAAIKLFIADYKLVKDSSDKVFKDFRKWQQQITNGLKHVKYYFPDYKLPENVITFIGPFDAFFATSFGIQGDVLTEEGLGVGLQLHLGKDFSFFKTETGRELYPEYLAETFTPDHIAVNCMKNIIDDLFPPAHLSQPLIEQMVNAGRKYYLLTRFLPKAKEEDLLGYTPEQMKSVHKNEAVIWDFFLNTDLLNSSEHDITKNYIGPAPKTQEFGEGSPGNIGSFSGLQIVRKYMNKFPETTLRELMEMPPREVYERSKYKPRG